MMAPASSFVAPRQRKDIQSFESCLREVDEYWLLVARRYIALLVVLVVWNVWNVYDLYKKAFAVDPYVISHSIAGGLCLLIFFKTKAHERLKRSSVHYDRLNAGLRLLNLRRGESELRELHHL